MKKMVTLSILGVLFALFFVFADNGIAVDKIGFVNVREIMMNSDSGKKANEELKKLYEKKRALIQESEAELKRMKDELEKQKMVLTEQALKEKEANYQQKIRDYQALVKEANETLQAKDQELSESMIPEIQKIINKIAEKEKYTVIFDVSAIPIPFYAKSNDITKLVMDEFNRSYKLKK